MSRIRDIANILSGATDMATDAEVTSSIASHAAAADPHTVYLKESEFGAAGKNLVINGGMDIWQRGTSFSQVSGYTADRWYLNASTTTTITRDTSILTPNSQYSMKATATGTQQIFFYQAIETANVINLAGKRVVLSGYVAGSSGVSTNINLSLGFSTSTDVAVTGTYTDITPVSAGNIITTTSMQRVSAVFDIPSTAKSLRVLFVNNAANITNGQSLYLGDVQLEVGSVATPFSRAGGTIAGELAACQRYLPATTGIEYFGYAYNAGSQILSVNFTVPARVAPTGITTSGTFTLFNSANSSSSVTPSFNSGGQYNGTFTTNGTATSGTPCRVQVGSNTSILWTGCEL